MATAQPAILDDDPVVVRLETGHYDRELADFRRQLAAATEALHRIHARMIEENTLRS